MARINILYYKAERLPGVHIAARFPPYLAAELTTLKPPPKAAATPDDVHRGRAGAGRITTAQALPL